VQSDLTRHQAAYASQSQDHYIWLPTARLRLTPGAFPHKPLGSIAPAPNSLENLRECGIEGTRMKSSMFKLSIRLSACVLASLMVVFGFSLGASAATVPTITSITPTSGVIGTAVTINGTNFGAAAPSKPAPAPIKPNGASQVIFVGADGGTCAATVYPAWTSWSNTQIQTIIPDELTGEVAYVYVETGNGISTNVVPFTVTPNITSISPNPTFVGNTIGISGSGFTWLKPLPLNPSKVEPKPSVFFGSVQANVTGWGDKSITAQVPTTANTTDNVSVTTAYGTSNSVSFTYLPNISTVSATSGIVGSNVTITGSHFGDGTNPTVHFGSASISIAGTSPVTVQVPAGLSGSNQIHVSNSAGNSNQETFYITPHITSLSPSSGPAGSVLIINGTGFDTYQNPFDSSQHGTVMIGTTSAQVVTWVDTQIKVKVPAITGATKVALYNTWGASNSVAFTVTPKLSSMSSTSGGAGDAVTLAGSGFSKTGKVYFGTMSAACTSWTSGAIRVKVPAIPKGKSVAVKVVVSGASSNTRTYVRVR